LEAAAVRIDLTTTYMQPRSDVITVVEILAEALARDLLPQGERKK